MTEEVDAGTVMRIAEVPVGTLNAWINRALIPGVSNRAQGRARMFDLELVQHIAVMAALVRLGYGAPFASMAAGEALECPDVPGARLIISPSRKGAYGLSATPLINVWWPQPYAKRLDDFLDQRIADGRPESYTVVELDKLMARVRKLFEEPDIGERARRAVHDPAAIERARRALKDYPDGDDSAADEEAQ
jgi:hypothetical protein